MDDIIRLENGKAIIDLMLLIPLLIVAMLIVLAVVVMIIKKSGQGFIKTTPAKLA